VIDLHCHVLPGIDDGPETIEGSLALARAAEACGISTIVATPHVSSRYPNDAATVARLVAQLNRRLAAEGVDLNVLPGAEIAMARLIDVDAQDLPGLQLGGGGWLLVEPPFSAFESSLDTLLIGLQQRGHRIVLAHPERCVAFRREPEMLKVLLAGGFLTSITAGSLVGRFGNEVRRFALELAEMGMVHNVASDAHDHRRRPPGIASELGRAGLAPLAGWLTQEVPAALLAGAEPPPRPDVALRIPRDSQESWWTHLP
jgi:protein-tyrosine phosphatase